MSVSTNPVSCLTQEACVLHIQGQDALNLLHRLCSADLKPLFTTHLATPALFTTAQGKLIDWVRVVHAPKGCFILCSSSERASRLATWIDTYTVAEDVSVHTVHNALLCTLYCTEEHPVLKNTGPGSVQSTPYGTWFKDLDVYGHQWLGMVFESERAAFEAWIGHATPVSPDAVEERRIRACVPSVWHEYAGEVQPLELGLGATSVSWKKGCYIGQEVLSRLDSYDKTARTLVCVQSKTAFKEGDKIYLNTSPLGKVTSALALSDHTHIGLAVVKSDISLPTEALCAQEGSAEKNVVLLTKTL